MVEQGIRGLLFASPAIAALVGTRIYPAKLPEATIVAGAPAITYKRISGMKVRSFKGSMGLARARIQLDCWGALYTDAKTLADNIRLAADDYTGTSSGWVILGSFQEDDSDGYEPPVLGDEVGYFRESLDLMVWFNETPSLVYP